VFYDWAFLKHRGDAINEIWKKIPKDVDILVTHGPPLGTPKNSTHCLPYDFSFLASSFGLFSSL
jgi:hypothetical protein